MKKILFFLTAILAVSITFIMITAQKPAENGKFYYAFNEKIFIDEVPNKFVVKFKDKQKANELKLFLIEQVGNDKKIQSKNETTVTIDLSSSGKSIDDILSSKMMDIELIKPAYKYQKQEMYYTNEILVEPLEGITINEVIQKNGLENSVKIKEGKFYSIVEISSNFDACDVANKIQESGLVKYSHPNFIMPVEKYQVIPNDTYFNNQYYLRNTGQVFNPAENHFGLPNADINASFAWNTTLGNNTIIVAVIDEGLTPNHPDLPNARQVRLNGSNFVPGENANDPTPGLNNNHGNSCTGIIAATQNNNEGVTGIAPNVRIMPIKVFGQNGNADNNGFAAALDFAWQNGAHVISNSWGYNSDNPNLVPAIVAAINRAVTQGRNGLGCVVSFAAGNTANHSLGNNGQIHFPGNVQINGVLTVGASDRDDIQADYSPTSNAASANNQIIDVVAPSHRAYPPAFGGIAGEGFEVWTIDIPGTNGYNQWNDATFPGTAPAFGEVLPTTGTNNLSYTGRMGGTSASCPQVAAVAALILSVNNNLTQQQIFGIITQSAEKVGGYTYNANGWSPELGNGRLNACAALSRIPNIYPINGVDIVGACEPFNVIGLPAGSTVQWISSNTLVANVSPTGVVTKVSNGNIVLTANIAIPNRCGVAISTKSIIVGSTITGYYRNNYGQNVPLIKKYEGINYVEPNSSSTAIVLNPEWESATWSWINGSYNYWEQSPGPDGNLLIMNLPVSGDLVDFRLTNNGTCGTEEFDFLFFAQSAYGGYYSISPNPTTSTLTVSVDEAKLATQKLAKSSDQDIREIVILDKTGMVQSKQTYGKGTRQVSMNISNLKTGIYIVRIFNGKEWTALKLVKE